MQYHVIIAQDIYTVALGRLLDLYGFDESALRFHWDSGMDDTTNYTLTLTLGYEIYDIVAYSISEDKVTQGFLLMDENQAELGVFDLIDDAVEAALKVNEAKGEGSC